MRNNLPLLRILTGAVSVLVGGAGLLLGMPAEILQNSPLPTLVYTSFFWMALVSGAIGIARGAFTYDKKLGVLPGRK